MSGRDPTEGSLPFTGGQREPSQGSRSRQTSQWGWRVGDHEDKEEKL